MKKKLKKTKTTKWVAVSGGFDPLHVGHVRMFKRARSLGDKLVVIVNNDSWLAAKKGFAFMPETERKELILSLPDVDKVVLTDHKEGDSDMSVCRILHKVRPAIFANGGDRVETNVPEYDACEKLGIQMKFGIGGGKVQSSSWMIEEARKHSAKTERPWGRFFNWDNGGGWHLKTLCVKPGARLSLQYHKKRSEQWVLVEGDAIATLGMSIRELRTIPLKIGEILDVPKGAIHRLSSERGGTVVEISSGDFDEDDIVRIEDDFGRVCEKEMPGQKQVII